MLLAADIGNTNITLGVWDGQIWRDHWRLRTEQGRTADEYGATLNALLRDADLKNNIKHVILASVVPPLTETFAEISKRYWGQTAVLFKHTLPTGIRVCTDEPAKTGTDRVANAVAAFHLRPGPSIIIDMGTATKLDVVTAAGDFLGGVIATGLGLAADALTSRAAQLSQVALTAPPQAIGRNTIHAIQSGLIFGYVSLIEGMVTRLIAEHPDNGRPITIIGTGGFINLVAPHTAVFDMIDPYLTLSGLCITHERLIGSH
jgi:type III pantothenate kinase